jgi:hypothetical protein
MFGLLASLSSRSRRARSPRPVFADGEARGLDRAASLFSPCVNCRLRPAEASNRTSVCRSAARQTPRGSQFARQLPVRSLPPGRPHPFLQTLWSLRSRSCRSRGPRPPDRAHRGTRSPWTSIMEGWTRSMVAWSAMLEVWTTCMDTGTPCITHWTESSNTQKAPRIWPRSVR